MKNFKKKYHTTVSPLIEIKLIAPYQFSKTSDKLNSLFPSTFQSQMPDPKTYKQHFENKHPKSELPADLKDV